MGAWPLSKATCREGPAGVTPRPSPQLVRHIDRKLGSSLHEAPAGAAHPSPTWTPPGIAWYVHFSLLCCDNLHCNFTRQSGSYHREIGFKGAPGQAISLHEERPGGFLMAAASTPPVSVSSRRRRYQAACSHERKMRVWMHDSRSQMFCGYLPPPPQTIGITQTAFYDQRI